MDERTRARDQDNSGEMNYFNLSTMQAATNNFSDANKLGEGGFGPVYKVKRLTSFFVHMHFWKLLYNLHLKIVNSNS
jgi:hypothetical protein